VSDSDPAAPRRVWQLTILAPCEWLTANKINDTWNRYARSRLTRQWRQAIVDSCRQGQLPTGEHRLDLIQVEAIARFRGRPPVRDSENLRPTLKAAIDGLTPERYLSRKESRIPVPGWGLIPDDSDKHLARADIRVGEPLPKTVIADHPGLLIITITELAPANSLF